MNVDRNVSYLIVKVITVHQFLGNVTRPACCHLHLDKKKEIV